MNRQTIFLAAMLAALFLMLPFVAPAQITTEMKLSAVLADSGIVKLQWGYPLNVPPNTFYIYRATLESSNRLDSTALQLIDSVGFVFGYIDRPEKGRTYAYRVLAVTALGAKFWSGWAAVYVPPPPVPFIKLVGSINESGKPALRWEPPAGYAFTKYYVYRAWYDPRIMTFAPVVPQLVDSTIGTSYVDEQPGFTSYGYLYMIRAASGGQSFQSNMITIVVQESLRLSAFPRADGNGIELQWSKPTNNGPLYYVVHRAMIMRPDENLDSLSFAILDTVAGTMYVDTKFPLVTVVFYGLAYRVTAIQANGQIVESNTAVVPWRLPTKLFTLAGRSSSEGVVELSWNDPPTVPAPKFYVFRAALRSNSTAIDPATGFSLLDSTGAHFYRDIPSPVVSNVYAYYVDARGEGMNVKSNLLTVVLPVRPQPDKVTIISEPPRTASIDNVMTYAPRALSSDPTAQLFWMLGAHPEGMTIDSVGGTLSWTPKVRGWFHVVLVVSSNRGGRAYQEFDISVSGASGGIKGSVTDTLGLPVPAFVAFYNRDASARVGYKAQTDGAGNFRIENVETGQYSAYAVPLKGDYLPQWYYQKNRQEEADQVTVAESSTATVDFRLAFRSVAVPTFTLSGRITDTAGQSISGAVVVFARSEYFFNSSKGGDTEFLRDYLGIVKNPESSIPGSSPYMFTVVTDRSGFYQVRIPKGSYVGYSYAPGFRRVFYKDQSNPLKADIIQADGDKSIDFILRVIPPVPLGSISGMVKDTAMNAGIPARVIAIRSGPNVQSDALFGSADSTGKYAITAVPPGEYLVLAVPMGLYAPAFYGSTKEFLRWKAAAPVSVNGNDISGIDIAVRPLAVSARGLASIRGTVVWGAGSNVAPSSQTFSGVNGSIVAATDVAGNVAGYAITDEIGGYVISGLAPLTYRVFSDCIGFEPTTEVSVSPTYDLNGIPTATIANFTVAASPTGMWEESQNGAPTEFVLLQNYPNPFNPTTTLQIRNPQSQILTLTVYDLLGRKVALLLNEERPAGRYTISFDASQLTSGVYLYTLRAGGLVETKKMILVK